MKIILVLAVAVSVFSSALYAGEQTGKIKSIIVRASDNLHYFTLEGSSTGKPACASIGYWMIKDENSIAGRSQLSILLSAQAQQKPIRIVGAGTCTRWRDGEDVDLMFIQ